MNKFLIATTISMICVTPATVHAQDVQNAIPFPYYVDSTCNGAIVGGYAVAWLKTDPGYSDYVMVIGSAAASGLPVSVYLGGTLGSSNCSGWRQVIGAMFGHW